MYRFTLFSKIFSSEKSTLSSRERNRLYWMLLLLLLFLLPTLYRRVVVTQEFLRRLDSGNGYIAQGLALEAEREWLCAERLAPNNPIVLQLLGALYVRQNRPAEARQALNRLADSAPNEPHVLCRFAALEFYRGGIGMRTFAQQDALRAAKLEPDCLDAQRIAGEVSFWVGEDEDGLNYLNRAIHVQPDNIPLRLYLISHLVRMKRLPKAIELAQEAQAQNPQAIMAHGVLGSLYRRLPTDSPEHKKAEAELQIALQKNPTNSTFCFELGEWYLLQKQPEKALKYLETARKNGYVGSAVWEALARTHQQLGDNRAFEQAQKMTLWHRNTEKKLMVLDRLIMDCPGNAQLHQDRNTLYQALATGSRSNASLQRREKFPLFLP
ncbi:hypothetical protein LBMAG21_10400 [Armatimonadota bacterium]|nr:hypothetical protein LBMAG21_10400 [Armatimonadota bacterium]